MPTTRSSPIPSLLRLLVAPATAAVTVAGVFVAGGAITDSFTGSVIATGVWFALAGAAALAVAVRSRALRVPVVAGYVVAAAAVSVYLGWSMLNDRVVNERVAAGAPQAAGAFRAGEHETSGRAAVVEVGGGRRVLTLTGFDTSPGPDLRVRLVPGASDDGGADGAIDLGALKGNRGDQQYDLPRDAPVRGASVVIWCRAFSATFGSAVLEARA
jgi:Electron transfer DM13